MDVQHKPVLECARVFRYVCRRSTFARHMALSCPGTALGSPDVLLFYHPPLAPCSLRFRESVSPAFNLLCCVCFFVCLFFCLFPVTNKPLEALCCFLFLIFLFFSHMKTFLENECFRSSSNSGSYPVEGDNFKLSHLGVFFDFCKYLKVFEPFDVPPIKN